MRKAASEVIVNFGPMMSMTGSLYSVKRSGLEKETSFKLACPIGDDPHGVTQGYTCDVHPGSWSTADCRRMREADDGTFVFATTEEIAAARKGDGTDEGKALDLSVYEASEVEAATYSSGNAYAYEAKGKSPLYGVLLALVQREESHGKALCGEIMMPRSGSKFVRLRVWHDVLVVQELLRPEEVNSFDIDVPLPEAKHVSMAETFLNQLTEPFDPELYRNQAAERVAALVQSKLDGTAPVPVAPTASKATQVDDLEAMFAASMVAVAASKAS